jgi:hypothetical protein
MTDNRFISKVIKYPTATKGYTMMNIAMNGVKPGNAAFVSFNEIAPESGPFINPKFVLHSVRPELNSLVVIFTVESDIPVSVRISCLVDTSQDNSER